MPRSDVSRGTPPPTPYAAAAVFGPELSRAEAYASWLAGAGVARGLIGPREVPRLWERHVLNCAVVAPLLGSDEEVPRRDSPDAGSATDPLDVVDVGSGAGLPGIPLALAAPGTAVTLVEPLLRRSTFLEEVVADLGLENVRVVRARAEEMAPAGFGVATARAVAPLSRLLPWTLPLVRRGGRLIALKGSSVQEEIDAAGAVLARLGGRVEVRTVGTDVVPDPVTVVVVTRTGGEGRR